MIVGIGLDLQRIDSVEAAEALRTPGLVFTESEHRHAANRRHPASLLACSFAAKEAILKALPEEVAYYWTDMELVCHDGHEPRFIFHGGLARLMAAKGWDVKLALSQGGDHVSALVVISGRSPERSLA